VQPRKRGKIYQEKLELIQMKYLTVSTIKEIEIHKNVEEIHKNACATMAAGEM